MKMMYKYYPLILAFTLCAPTISHTVPHKRVPQEIDSAFLRAIDGIPDAIDVASMIGIIHGFGKLLHRTKTSTPTDLVSYKGEHYTIVQLAELEKKAAAADKQALRAALKVAQQKITQVAGGTLEKLRKRKQAMTMIIEAWCRQNNRMDSLLLPWNTKTETQLANEDLTSFHALSNFLQDLVNLLLDVLHTCKKSVAQYKNEHPAKH